MAEYPCPNPEEENYDEMTEWWSAQFPMRDVIDLYEMLYAVPDYMTPGILRYVLYGVPPGSFLTAVISNDLELAAAKADENNFKCLGDYVRLMHNFFPTNAHGSKEAMVAFCESGGITKWNKS